MLVTIKDSLASAVIDSTGAQLISFKDVSGTEYIWQRDPKFWDRCSPLLFPIIGNCRNNQTTLEDTVYTIPKHGFCRDADFAVQSGGEGSVTFEMGDTEETKKMYPYGFRLALIYTLKDGCLSISYQVTNTDERTMYYCLGAHPGFNCPLTEGETFEDYVLEFEKEETASTIVYDIKNLAFDPDNRIPLLNHSKTIPLKREMFCDDALYFDSLKSRKVSILNPDTGKGIEVSYPGFETVAFWTPYPADAPFLCVEPWNGSAIYKTEDDDFTHKNHVQSLKPKETRAYGLSIRYLI